MDKIKIAIVGVGNCTSSLLQGIEYYKYKDSKDAIGLMHWEINGYKPYDIEVAAAFDIDKRKVGKDVSEAIFEYPNCTVVFCKDVPKADVKVKMGVILDGFSDHMKNYDDRYTFVLNNENEPSKEDIVNTLKESGAEMLLNYLPVGSEEATKFYAECALEARVAFINNIPSFIASDPEWAKKFEEKNIRVEVDEREESVGKKIADSRKQRIPYTIVFGEKEEKSEELSIRLRSGKVEKFGINKFVEKVEEEIDKKQI